MITGKVINNLQAGGSKLVKSADAIDHPDKPNLSLVRVSEDKVLAVVGKMF